MCVDYHQLNGKTRRDAFPLPRIEDSLDALHGAQWFLTMDLSSGYNQVPVAEKDKAKTAFCTPFGLFEFNRLQRFNLPSSTGETESKVGKMLFLPHQGKLSWSYDFQGGRGH